MLFSKSAKQIKIRVITRIIIPVPTVLPLLQEQAWIFGLTKEVDHQAVELFNMPENEPLTQRSKKVLIIYSLSLELLSPPLKEACASHCSVPCKMSLDELETLCRRERLHCKALGVNRANLNDYEVEYLCDYKKTKVSLSVLANTTAVFYLLLANKIILNHSHIYHLNNFFLFLFLFVMPFWS